MLRKRKWTRRVTSVLEVAPGEDEGACPNLCSHCAHTKRFCSTSRQETAVDGDETAAVDETFKGDETSEVKTDGLKTCSDNQACLLEDGGDSSTTAVNVWEDPRSSRLASAVPSPVMSVSLEEKKEELKALWHSQTILLKFAKECRLSMHSNKNNFIRLSVWSDCVAVAKEAERQRSVRQSTSKETIMKIRAQMPVASSSFSPGGKAEQKLRLRLAQQSRRWNSKMSLKLRDIVGEAMIYETTGLRMILEPFVKAEDTDMRRLELRSQYADIDFSDDASMAKLLIELETLLTQKNQRDPTFDVAIFWATLWDSIAQALGGTPPRSGRECQIHWLHRHHPQVNRSPWTKEEESSVLQLVDELGGGRWQEVADRLGTLRTPYDIYRHYQRALNTNLVDKEWTEEETARLVDLVHEHKGERVRLWRRIAANFPKKTNEQCRLRWERVSRDNLKSGSWSAMEDIQLQVLVHIFGRGRWVKIAEYMPQRSDVKCRERFENLLAPELRRGRWTEEEDARLLSLVDEFGSGNWAEVQAHLEGRTDAECFKRWQRLDPTASSREGAVRAAKIIFIPTQVKTRLIRPALTGRDFSLATTEHLEALLERLGLPADKSRSSQLETRWYRQVFRHKIHYYSNKRPAHYSETTTPILSITDSNSSSIKGELSGRSEEHSSPGSEGRSESQSLTPRDVEGVKRLSLFRRYLEHLSTGSAEADSQLQGLKRLLLSHRCTAYKLPGEAVDRIPLTKDECTAVDELVQAEYTTTDCILTVSDDETIHLKVPASIEAYMTPKKRDALVSLIKATLPEYDHEARQDLPSFPHP